MKIIRIDTMRKLEQQAIASGVPGYELMRRAGEGAAREIRAFARGREFGRAVVLAGRGNNGGDALVVAARLGLPVTIYATGPLNELRGEAAEAARDLPENIEVRVCDGLTGRDFRRDDLIIDGLLGTGFTGELRPGSETGSRRPTVPAARSRRWISPPGSTAIRARPTPDSQSGRS